MESKRVSETKRKIKVAFLELYKKKRIEKISIKEITEKAQVNRGTFYVYYIDIYDLKEKIEDETIEKIKTYIFPVIKELLENKRIESTMLEKEFFLRERAALELFFSESAETRAIKKLKDFMQAVIIEMLNLPQNLNDVERVKIKYALEYITSAQLGIMGYWFRNNMELPMNELKTIIESINLTGAITYVMNIGVESDDKSL